MSIGHRAAIVFVMVGATLATYGTINDGPRWFSFGALALAIAGTLV